MPTKRRAPLLLAVAALLAASAALLWWRAAAAPAPPPAPGPIPKVAPVPPRGQPKPRGRKKRMPNYVAPGTAEAFDANGATPVGDPSNAWEVRRGGALIDGGADPTLPGAAGWSVEVTDSVGSPARITVTVPGGWEEGAGYEARVAHAIAGNVSVTFGVGAGGAPATSAPVIGATHAEAKK